MITMEVLVRITDDGEIEIEEGTSDGRHARTEDAEATPIDESGLPEADAFEAVAPPLEFRPEGEPEGRVADAATPPRRFSVGR